MKNPLDNRAVGALAVVAASIVLLMCLVSYGPAEFAGAAELSLLASIGKPLIWLAGAGAYALVLVPLAWGVIVYFREDTPDLLLRAVGTVALAATTAIVAGLFAGPSQHTLATGFIGHEAALFVEGWGGMATTLAWLLVLATWFAALMLATDFLFHRVRRDPHYFTSAPATHGANTFVEEPQRTAFREDTADPVADMVVGFDVAASDTAYDEPADPVDEPVAEPRTEPRAEPPVGAPVDAQVVAAEPRVEERIAEEAIVQPHPASNAMHEVPDGWSSRTEGGRTVLRGPTGYRGVEFLEPSDELALPEPAPDPEMVPEGGAAVLLFEDEFVDDALPAPDQAGGEEDLHEALTDEIALPEDLLTAFGDEHAFQAGIAAEPGPQQGLPEHAEEERAEVERGEEEQVGAQQAETEAVGIGYPEGTSVRDEVFELQHGVVVDFVPGLADVDLGSFGHETPEPAAPTQAEPAPAAVADAQPVVSFDEQMAQSEPVSRLPATQAAEPSVPPADAAPFEEPDQPLLEEVLFSDVDVSLFDDVVLEPTPVAAQPAPEPAPEPTREPALVHAGPAEAAAAEAVASTQSSASPAWAAHPAIERVQSMDLDPLFHEGVDAVLARGRASAVSLQRALGVGYSRGLRMLDQMSQAGLIGPDQASGAREILIEAAVWEEFTGRPVR